MTNAIVLGVISQGAGMFSKQNHTRDFYTAKAAGADTRPLIFCLVSVFDGALNCFAVFTK